MKKINIIYTFCVLTLALVGCAKSDTTTNAIALINPTDSIIGENSLIINEIKCRKPDDFTLYGDTTKWIELYNPKNINLTLEKNKWYFTDSIGYNQKYNLDSNIIVPAKGFLVIWFEKQTPIIKTASFSQFNITNFSISKTTGDFGVFYKKTDSTSAVLINKITYNYPNDQPKTQSNGRKPDGTGVFQLLDKVTLGNSNN